MMSNWIGRLLIGAVLLFNVHCALSFIINPGLFAPSFELQGIPGSAAVRGIGILFLMWNVPYCVAFWNPRRYRVSLYEAIAMQFIGLVGEIAVLGTLPLTYSMARSSLLRFILFDSGGLVALAIAARVTCCRK